MSKHEKSKCFTLKSLKTCLFSKSFIKVRFLVFKILWTENSVFLLFKNFNHFIFLHDYPSNDWSKKAENYVKIRGLTSAIRWHSWNLHEMSITLSKNEDSWNLEFMCKSVKNRKLVSVVHLSRYKWSQTGLKNRKLSEIYSWNKTLGISLWLLTFLVFQVSKTCRFLSTPSHTVQPHLHIFNQIKWIKALWYSVCRQLSGSGRIPTIINHSSTILNQKPMSKPLNRIFDPRYLYITDRTKWWSFSVFLGPN